MFSGDCTVEMFRKRFGPHCGRCFASEHASCLPQVKVKVPYYGKASMVLDLHYGTGGTLSIIFLIC